MKMNFVEAAFLHVRKKIAIGQSNHSMAKNVIIKRNYGDILVFLLYSTI